MSDAQEISQLPTDFAGVVRLFPLPNLVLFPHVIQPLHVFEPRYRELLEDALAHDQLIAMAHLAPGWENEYQAQPPVAPVVCIGRIVNHVALADGKYNVLLVGVRRARIVRELPLSRSFRQAEVTVLEDVYGATGAKSRAAIRRRLLASFQSFLPNPKSENVQGQIEQLLNQEISLGVLTDMVAHTMNFTTKFKLQLLGEPKVDRRAALLVDHFEEYLAANSKKPAKSKSSKSKSAKSKKADDSSPPFPPKFSLN